MLELSVDIMQVLEKITSGELKLCYKCSRVGVEELFIPRKNCCRKCWSKYLVANRKKKKEREKEVA